MSEKLESILGMIISIVLIIILLFVCLIMHQAFIGGPLDGVIKLTQDVVRVGQTFDRQAAQITKNMNDVSELKTTKRR